MVSEVLIVFLAWVALAVAIKYLFAFPWVLAVPAAIAILILYDSITSEEENRRR